MATVQAPIAPPVVSSPPPPQPPPEPRPSEPRPEPIRLRGLSVAARRLLVAGSVAVAAAVVVPVAGFNPIALVALSAVIHAVVIYAVSRRLEGHRHAVDRVVTTVVTTFFLFALIPLVSVLTKVLLAGFRRMDVQFFTYSCVG